MNMAAARCECRNGETQNYEKDQNYSSSSSEEDLAKEYSFKFLNVTSNGISSNKASLFTNIIQDVGNTNKVRKVKVNSQHLVELECKSSYQADRVVKKLKMLSFNQQIIKVEKRLKSLLPN